MAVLFRSLTLRLALLSAAWVAIGLTLAGWLILSLATEQLLQSFDARLVNLLDAVAGAASLGEDGKPRLGPVRALSEPNFGQPYSGYYWQIAAPGAGSANSRSLWDARLPPYDLGAGPGLSVADVPGPRGQRLRLAQRPVVPEDRTTPLLVQVAVSRDGLDRDLGRLRLLVGGTFALLGLGLVAGVAAQVVWGLAPLRRARRALAEVRAGTRKHLGTEAAPAELAPLLEEIDGLVAQNRATVERARAHVGNLAHALKTPIAVQRTALDGEVPDLATARAQAGAMEHLVQHHLTRARAAALSGSAAAESAPLAVAGEIARALRRLFAERDIEITVVGDAAARVRVDNQDLAEMVGNLLENACKWARRRVTLRVATGAAGAATGPTGVATGATTVARDVAAMASGGTGVTISVADDGPGLPSGARDVAIARGTRLDETAPGSGLGLAIVRDLVELYGGCLELGAAPEGGLLARLWLPGR